MKHSSIKTASFIHLHFLIRGVQMQNIINKQFYKQQRNFEKSCVERERKFTFPDGVTCTENIQYTSNDKAHLLDLYRPKQMDGQILPIIINVHGGGLLLGNKEFNKYFCA